MRLADRHLDSLLDVIVAAVVDRVLTPDERCEPKATADTTTPAGLPPPAGVNSQRRDTSHGDHNPPRPLSAN